MDTKTKLSQSFTVLLFLMFFGCGEAQNPLKHDLSSPVRSSNAWNWLPLTESEFTKDVLSRVGHPEQMRLSSEFAALEARAQFWLDQIDQALRRVKPNELQFVPPPKAKVIREDSLNAFVAADLVCYKVPVIFSGEGSQEVQGVYFDFSETKFQKWSSQDECHEAKELETLERSLMEYNRSSGSCKLQFINNRVKVSGDCDQSESLAKISKAKMLIIPRTTNWITIHSGLFSSVPTEETFLSILAHEASHYYRSHPTSLPGEFDFFYKQHEQHTDRPVADPTLTDEGQRAIGASEFLDFPLYESPTLKIPSELYFASGGLAKEYCKKEENNCTNSCRVLGEADQNKAFIQGMGGFPFQAPPNETVYKKYFTLTKKCLESIPDTKSNRNSLTQVLESPDWMPLLEYLSLVEARMMMGIISKIPERVGAEPEALFSNMYQVFEHLSQNLHQKHEEALGILKRARDSELVQYTTEQEADELMGEILQLLGLSPARGVDSFLFLAGESETRMGGLFLGGHSCKEWYERDWKDLDGNPGFIPIGDYTDTHHSSCFRAFNLAQDLKRHKYMPRSDKIASSFNAPGGSWWDLAELARKANAPVSGFHQDEEMLPIPSDLFKDAQGALTGCPLSPRHLHLSRKSLGPLSR